MSEARKSVDKLQSVLGGYGFEISEQNGVIRITDNVTASYHVGLKDVDGLVDAFNKADSDEYVDGIICTFIYQKGLSPFDLAFDYEGGFGDEEDDHV